MSTVVDVNLTNYPGVRWEKGAEETSPGYRCYIALVREDDGSFSAIVVNLPGCGSCGDSEAEAIENVKEAIQGTIESYVAADEEIPWIDPTCEERPEGTVRTTWIVVNA